MPRVIAEAIEQTPAVQFTPKQRVFIAAYLRLRNGTAAAEEAGYSKRSARQIASEWLTEPAIKAEIERRIEALIDRYEISADRIARELASIAFGSIDDYIVVQDDGSAIVDLVGTTKRQLSALASFEVEEYIEGRGLDAVRVKRTKIKPSDKQAALMNLAKLRRMLPADRLEHSGSVEHVVRPEHTIDIESMDQAQREALRTLLLNAVRSKTVTDVEDLNEDDDD